MDSTDDRVAEERTTDSLLGKFFSKCLLHPLEYARFLAQVGHRPMNSHCYLSVFDKGYWMFPNFLAYAKYMHSINGFKGMYVGLSPTLISTAVEHALHILLFDYIKFGKPSLCYKYYCLEDSNLKLWKKCAQSTFKELLFTSITTVLSYPFYVVALRMMAQVVHHEHRYTSVLNSLSLIYREEGLSGLYAGIIPRLLAVFGSMILANSTKQAFSNYVSDSKFPLIATDVFEIIFPFLVNMFTYPFHVVSACSAINNCGLSVGMPPEMPVFGNWLDCMRYLYNLKCFYLG